MPRYLDTRGEAYLAIAVCDRCRLKVRYTELRPDGNSPGLRVCADCCDQYDPWRLPARRTEDVTLPNPRPDEPLT
jgi:hypothetical protein